MTIYESKKEPTYKCFRKKGHIAGLDYIAKCYYNCNNTRERHG